MSSNEDDLDFVAKSFDRNIRAMRVFFHRFGGAASEYDREALNEFTNALNVMVPDSVLARAHEGAAGSGSGEAPELTPEEKERIREAVRNPDNLRDLTEAIKTLHKAAPQQSVILLESTLVTLMSHLEGLIADLMHSYYEKFPAALPADERSLSLTDLRELGSIEEGEKFLVSKEVDSVLRESLEAQFNYLSKKFKLNISALDPYRDRLVEIAQRRNLYVHNRGVVNRTYLKRVEESLATEYSAEIGSQLKIATEYVAQALDIVEIAGAILIQQAWRKWDQGSLRKADSTMVQVLFDGLEDRRYTFVTSLAGFASNIDYSEDITARMVCINHAIALREMGRAEEVESLLRTHDWSACSLKFQLALTAVRDQEEDFYSSLPRAKAADEISRNELMTWPLFRNFRETDRFLNTVSELFPEEQACDSD